MPDPKRCPRCQGCGKIANDDDGSPWTAWENLPPGSDAAVKMGIVKPIECPSCLGTGKPPTRTLLDPALEVPAADAEREWTAAERVRAFLAARSKETEAEVDLSRARKALDDAIVATSFARERLKSCGARTYVLPSQQDAAHAVVVVVPAMGDPAVFSGLIESVPA